MYPPQSFCFAAKVMHLRTHGEMLGVAQGAVVECPLTTTARAVIMRSALYNMTGMNWQSLEGWCFYTPFILFRPMTVPNASPSLLILQLVTSLHSVHGLSALLNCGNMDQ